VTAGSTVLDKSLPQWQDCPTMLSPISNSPSSPATLSSLNSNQDLHLGLRQPVRALPVGTNMPLDASTNFPLYDFHSPTIDLGFKNSQGPRKLDHAPIFENDSQQYESAGLNSGFDIDSDSDHGSVLKLLGFETSNFGSGIETETALENPFTSVATVASESNLIVVGFPLIIYFNRLIEI